VPWPRHDGLHPYVAICRRKARKTERIERRGRCREEEDREKPYCRRLPNTAGSAVATRTVAVIPFRGVYGDNPILRMILVAITSKLPWRGLSLRAARGSERISSVARNARQRERPYCC